MKQKKFVWMSKRDSGKFMWKGKKQNRLGTEVSKETREKLRIANTGKKMSEESKKKVSIARKEYWRKLHETNKSK